MTKINKAVYGCLGVGMFRCTGYAPQAIELKHILQLHKQYCLSETFDVFQVSEYV